MPNVFPCGIKTRGNLAEAFSKKKKKRNNDSSRVLARKTDVTPADS